jgi:Flp pilus assembly protein TadB
MKTRPAKRHTRWSVLLVPEGLSDATKLFWPDLSVNPTGEVKAFRKMARRNPSIRLEVMSGLRRYAESSSGIMLSLAAFFISFAALTLAMYGSATPGFVVFTVPVATLAILVLVLFVQAAVNLEERRKAAIVWLGALDESWRR